jgi:hypothetical protein
MSSPRLDVSIVAHSPPERHIRLKPNNQSGVGATALQRELTVRNKKGHPAVAQLHFKQTPPSAAVGCNGGFDALRLPNTAGSDTNIPPVRATTD